METFQLIFKHSRCGELAKLPLEEHLSLLKFSDKACDKIMKSKSIVLKRNLNYEDAVTQHKAFISNGLETTIQLSLNSELFYLGLVEAQ